MLTHPATGPQLEHCLRLTQAGIAPGTSSTLPEALLTECAAQCSEALVPRRAPQGASGSALLACSGCRAIRRVHLDCAGDGQVAAR